MTGSWPVKLDVFEGPLDLLLHLIKRNEVQITDIPIALITDQYLATLEQLPELNLDGAGEYLVMAATLMLIKSKMLLPPEPGADGEVEEDPRAELVQQLLEYQRYREAAERLMERPVLERDVFRGGGEPLERSTLATDGPPVRDATLGDLLAALRAVLARAQAPQPHEIFRAGLSVGECAQRILARFALGNRVAFDAFFEPDAGRDEIVVTFLALLELIRLRAVRAGQSERFGEITVWLATETLGEAVELARQLTDAEIWGRSGEDDERQRSRDH
ncbi:MAG TPA: segregation/condensation protein A [Candidatus Limnocylindria bacterium]|nr:segregation/condensation protein A [Candidatus Limnocylindria bacterium]